MTLDSRDREASFPLAHGTRATRMSTGLQETYPVVNTEASVGTNRCGTGVG